jgi:hypothetical protein
MKALLDVFKAGDERLYPIDVGRWTKIGLDDQSTLARIARSGIGWNQLNNNVLVPGGTTLTPQLNRFLNDVTYAQLFSRDPAIAAFPDRLTAVEAACNNAEFKNALTEQPKLVPKPGEDGKPQYVLTHALTAQSDLISGLDAQQIKATERMFRSGPEGKALIKKPEWKTFSPAKMFALCDAFQNDILREVLHTYPGIVEKFDSNRIYATMNLFIKGEAPAAYMVARRANWENMTLEEINAVGAV